MTRMQGSSIPKLYLDNISLKSFPIEINNFLSSKECNKIINIAKKTELRHVREKNYFFRDIWISNNNKKLNKETDFLRSKIKKYFGTKKNKFEELCIRGYKRSGNMHPHYDGGKSSGPIWIYSLLFYLNDNFDGGSTHFTNINKYIKPCAGKLVIIRNLCKNKKRFYYRSKHRACPIKKGEKWISLQLIKK